MSDPVPSRIFCWQGTGNGKRQRIIDKKKQCLSQGIIQFLKQIYRYKQTNQRNGKWFESYWNIDSVQLFFWKKSPPKMFMVMMHTLLIDLRFIMISVLSRFDTENKVCNMSALPKEPHFFRKWKVYFIYYEKREVVFLAYKVKNHCGVQADILHTK